MKVIYEDGNSKLNILKKLFSRINHRPLIETPTTNLGTSLSPQEMASVSQISFTYFRTNLILKLNSQLPLQ